MGSSLRSRTSAEEACALSILALPPFTLCPMISFPDLFCSVKGKESTKAEKGKNDAVNFLTIYGCFLTLNCFLFKHANTMNC